MANQNVVLNRLDEHLNTLNGALADISSSLNEIKANLPNALNKFIVWNNKRLASYMIDVIKIIHANKYNMDITTGIRLVECFEQQCLADEFKLFEDYAAHQETLQKENKYFKMALMNKRNIFMDAQPRCQLKKL